MFRELVESLYGVTVVEWGNWVDEDTQRFAVLNGGQLVVADSIEALILALAPIEQRRAA